MPQWGQKAVFLPESSSIKSSSVKSVDGKSFWQWKQPHIWGWESVLKFSVQ
ncbi:hypothetical protein l11_14110 [Neisseria weaveri LMG 5135]|nr:hypothetical protein l13_17300 [Neisseria weaveri ATCC 51223]EGV37050.1 hypothetical protein l11_14110 [Neisseria weaveri LMG 5135]